MAETQNNEWSNQGTGSVPPIIDTAQPSSPHKPNPKPGFIRKLLTILLSLCLGLFLVDAAFSLIDDSLILFFGLHSLSNLRGLTSFFAFLMTVGIYVVMGLTPMVPKRLFLPIPLFSLATMLAAFPFAIYCFNRIPQVAVGFSACQVVLGLLILNCSQGGLKIRWPLVPENRLGIRRFSWGNIFGFVLLNIFVLVPLVAPYLFLCASLAVDHYTAGFMALHPGGFTVEVRKYVRKDGKTIELFPMSHVADAGFYQQVSRTFPTNSIILTEGVTDVKNLLTNKLSYQRLANSLGLSEQKVKFKPIRGELVRADVDVDQFSPGTIDILNLFALTHAKGLNRETIQPLIHFSPSPQTLNQLFDDILRKRNQHLVEEIQSHLLLSDNIMVPWGVAHMPGIAKAILKMGFHLDETHKYTVIRFHIMGNQAKSTNP